MFPVCFLVFFIGSLMLLFSALSVITNKIKTYWSQAFNHRFLNLSSCEMFHIGKSGNNPTGESQ
jgi:hypothetical protein